MKLAQTYSSMNLGSAFNTTVVSYPAQFFGGKAANQNAAPPQNAAAPNQVRRSVELEYAEYMARNKNNSSFSGVVYVWTVNHWAALNPNLAERNAFRWLSARHPAVATHQKAAACVLAALDLLPELPKRDESRAVLGLKNAYLEIMPDGSLRRLNPSPEFGLTSVLNCNLPGAGRTYTPQPVPADSLLWHYLTTSLPDLEVRNFLQEMAGDTLVPNVRFQVAALLKGKGRNGKSIYTRLLAALHSLVARMRLDRLGGFNLLPMLGASLAIVDEVPKGGIDEQTFKMLVSGETVSVDIKHRDPVAAPMTAKWVICTNNDQKSSDNSDGFWRRLAVIPFDTQIAEKDVIPELDTKIIQNELVLFLDWCLVGLQRLMVRGKMPNPPQAVQSAKQAAVLASNSVLAWIDDTAVFVGAGSTCKDKVFDTYDKWCRFNNLSPLSSPPFWKAMHNQFGDAVKVSQGTQNGKRIRVVSLTLPN